MKRAVVFNLGCKVNQYECAKLAAGLAEQGYEVHTELVPAELFIINTCAVTAEAERKSRQIMSRIRAVAPTAEIIVTGCASESQPDFYRAAGASYVTGVSVKYLALDNIGNRRTSVLPHKKEFEVTNITDTVARTRQFLKIQDGCNAFCSYCIIPYLRGMSRSRSIADTVAEAELMSANSGEIVLTGINMSQYGADIGVTLSDLITAMQHIDARIRLGSFYAEGITEELLVALKGLKHFAPHFHLSLQSGDDGVLRDMNRRYTTEIFLDKVALVRKFFADAAITTDIIVGYPTESDAAFENTLFIARKAQFADIHIFPYSKRRGTVAESLPPLPPQVVKERRLRLNALRGELSKSYLTSLYDKKTFVIFETEHEGYSVGYTDEYVRAYVKGNSSNSANIIYKTTYKDGIIGEIYG